jgi:hypothetical protein
MKHYIEMKLRNVKHENLNWTDLNHSAGNWLNIRDTKNNLLYQANLADTQRGLSYEVCQSVSES